MLTVPPLNEWTNEKLQVMKSYVSNIELLFGEAENIDEEESGLPWYMIGQEQKQVMDKMRELSDYVDKNKNLENRVHQFFITFGEIGERFGCKYSLYQAGNLLRDNLERTPDPAELEIALTPSGNEDKYYDDGFWKFFDFAVNQDYYDSIRKAIERALEFYFLEIENMDLYLKKLRKCKNENEPLEKMEAKRIQVKSKKGFLAFNCCRCKTTCVEPTLAKNTDANLRTITQCRYNLSCSCPGSEHTYQRLVWRVNIVKVDKSITEMKMEYQAKYKRGKIKTKNKLIEIYEYEKEEKKRK